MRGLVHLALLAPRPASEPAGPEFRLAQGPRWVTGGSIGLVEGQNGIFGDGIFRTFALVLPLLALVAIAALAVPTMLPKKFEAPGPAQAPDAAWRDGTPKKFTPLEAVPSPDSVLMLEDLLTQVDSELAAVTEGA